MKTEPKHARLVKRWQRLSELTGDVNEQMKQALMPFLKLYGFDGGEIYRIEVHSKMVVIDYKFFWRNETDYKTIRIPREVFDCEDIETAVEQAAAVEARRRADLQRANAEADVARLERELDAARKRIGK